MSCLRQFTHICSWQFDSLPKKRIEDILPLRLISAQDFPWSPAGNPMPSSPLMQGQSWDIHIGRGLRATNFGCRSISSVACWIGWREHYVISERHILLIKPSFPWFSPMKDKGFRWRFSLGDWAQNAWPTMFAQENRWRLEVYELLTWQTKTINCLVVWNMAFIFHILGMSSSQLTNIFQRGRYTTNQINLHFFEGSYPYNIGLMIEFPTWTKNVRILR